jgi:hypothetical protein
MDSNDKQYLTDVIKALQAAGFDQVKRARDGQSVVVGMHEDGFFRVLPSGKIHNFSKFARARGFRVVESIERALIAGGVHEPVEVQS